MQYEIFYSYGGHCGPYPTLESAQADAHIKAVCLKQTIYIQERDANDLGNYGRTVDIIRYSPENGNNVSNGQM